MERKWRSGTTDQWAGHAPVSDTICWRCPITKLNAWEKKPTLQDQIDSLFLSFCLSSWVFPPAGSSVGLEASLERFYLLCLVIRSFFLVCVGWKVRVLRVNHSPSAIHFVHSFNEVQFQVNGGLSRRKVSGRDVLMWKTFPIYATLTTR